jgi:lipopolysaccharide/colanic/teichoic acid biosynthesis glycosyltransferase
VAAIVALPVRARVAVAVGAATKRTFDVVVGGVLFLVALPLMLVLALGVAASLRYWPFFVQQRPGRQGRMVTIVKLRTLPSYTPRYMHKHVLGLATIKLPWLCALMRRTHLDELPQLGSVVLGTMSLVGPRPALPASAEPIEPGFDLVRRSVRPGCTGLWQISVAAHDALTSDPCFDLFYVDNASLRLDIWIVLRTVGWMLGVVKPIEIDDIPRWTLGGGLVRDRTQCAEPVRLEHGPLFNVNSVALPYIGADRSCPEDVLLEVAE